MKKTYNINLNGQVFCIDDDACLKLQSYIDTLESHYLKEEDGRITERSARERIQTSGYHGRYRPNHSDHG